MAKGNMGEKTRDGRMSPALRAVIVLLIGAALAAVWLFLLWGILSLVHGGEEDYDLFSDVWYWISFAFACVVSWLIEYFSYKAVVTGERERCLMQSMLLKRHVAGDGRLTDLYEKRRGMPRRELKELVKDGLKDRKAYRRGLFRTREGLALISVFMDDPPRASRSEEEAILSERGKTVRAEKSGNPVSVFDLVLDT